jgi:hypothetical protein
MYTVETNRQAESQFGIRVRLSLRFKTLLLLSNVKEESFEHTSKQDLSIVSTDRGIKNAGRDEHFSNKEFRSTELLHSGSDLRLETDVPSLLQPFEIVAIDEGIQIN